jgi:hypothetical protein
MKLSDVRDRLFAVARCKLDTQHYIEHEKMIKTLYRKLMGVD